MRDWARRRAHLKVPLGRRLCDCSECHDRSESCTCFCILYWASPCQQLYSSYLLHCTSTSLDQQTGFPLSSCLLSCSQSRKSLYRAWIDRSRLSPAGSPWRTWWSMCRPELLPSWCSGVSCFYAHSQWGWRWVQETSAQGLLLREALEPEPSRHHLEMHCSSWIWLCGPAISFERISPLPLEIETDLIPVSIFLGEYFISAVPKWLTLEILILFRDTVMTTMMKTMEIQQGLFNLIVIQLQDH